MSNAIQITENQILEIEKHIASKREFSKRSLIRPVYPILDGYRPLKPANEQRIHVEPGTLFLPNNMGDTVLQLEEGWVTGFLWEDLKAGEQFKAVLAYYAQNDGMSHRFGQLSDNPDLMQTLQMAEIAERQDWAISILGRGYSDAITFQGICAAITAEMYILPSVLERAERVIELTELIWKWDKDAVVTESVHSGNMQYVIKYTPSSPLTRIELADKLLAARYWASNVQRDINIGLGNRTYWVYPIQVDKQFGFAKR